MAHKEQLQFVKTVANHLATDWSRRRILEIGSFDVNGSVRPFFRGGDYVGVDMTQGPGVDIVGKGNELDFEDASFDACLSCECFEHDQHWRDTFRNMYRMTKPGGALIFSCATSGRLEHGTLRTEPRFSPGTQSCGLDYYRNLTARDFEREFNLSSMFSSHFFQTNRSSSDLYFCGIKGGDAPILQFNKQVLASAVRETVERTRREHREEAESAPYPYPFPLKLAARLAMAPVHAARLLPDRLYQDFALSYIKSLESVKQPFRGFKEERR